MLISHTMLSLERSCCHWELIVWPDQLQVSQRRAKAARGGNPLWCQRHWMCYANLSQSLLLCRAFLCCMCGLRKYHRGWRSMRVCVVYGRVRARKKKRKRKTRNLTQTRIPYWIILFETSYIKPSVPRMHSEIQANIFHHHPRTPLKDQFSHPEVLKI